MCKNQTVAVVIPIYKDYFSEVEQISLKQTLEILKQYDIFFVMPESLEVATDTKEIIREERFSDCFFDSIDAYNNLMLNEEFYRRFRDYEYILICQLDVFVFEDKLRYFCELGYDYVGAPWLSGFFFYKDAKHTIWHVGNGGFSLRKVDACIKILRKQAYLLDNRTINEDVFFSLADGEEFSVAPLNIALQFSWEMEVRECFEKNYMQLPFGCHAWHRFDLRFLKPYIERYGYVVCDELLCYGNEDVQRRELYQKQRRNACFWENEYRIAQVRNCISEKFLDINKKYAIWGAGYWGMNVCTMLKEANLPVEVFIDKNIELQNRKICNVDVIDFDKYMRRNEDCNIIIALQNGENKVAEQLEKAGYLYREDYIYIRDIAFFRDI